MDVLPPPIIPKALKQGDTIAFISPSARLNEVLPTPLARSVSYFMSKGYPVKVIYTPIPPHSEQPRFLVKARHVANEIHSAFLDDAVTCIISTIGGTELNEVLRHLDYDLIRAHPKIFVGYSDNTMLIYALYSKAGLRSFYGPCIFTEFAEFPEPNTFTADHFFQVLTGQNAGKQVPNSTHFSNPDVAFLQDGKAEDTPELRPTEPTPAPKFVRPGTAKGPIFGGCLRKVVALYGSEFLDPDMHKGAILFLEVSASDDGPMPLARVRADLVDLMNTGLFDGIVGLVFGRTYGYDEKMNRKLEDLIGDLVDGGRKGGWRWPVLMGVDIGHTSPMITVPFGAQTLLDSTTEMFMFLEEGVS